MISELRNKSNINSVVTTIVDGDFEITKIPFPAVTIFSSYPKAPLGGMYDRNKDYFLEMTRDEYLNYFDNYYDKTYIPYMSRLNTTELMLK